MDELIFIRVYMEITGESEGRARAVAMYVDLQLENQRRLPDGSEDPWRAGWNDRAWNDEPQPL